MNKIIKRIWCSNLKKFILSGGIAAAVNILLRYVLTPSVGYSTSVVLAYLCAMTLAWLLSRFFVFSASASSPAQEYMRFTVVNILALIQVWAVSLFLYEYFFEIIGFKYYPETAAHIIGVIWPVLPSYFLHKHFTFKR